jgi:hypothetical protein
MHIQFWLRNVKGIVHSEVQNLGESIILKWILGKSELDSSGSVYGLLAGACEHGA